MKPSREKVKVLAVVLLAGVLPLLASLTARSFWGDVPGVHESLPVVVELAGTFIALGVAMLLLLRLRHETASSHLLWVVAALVAMGLVDGLHAVHGISIHSWQRHGATLLGGVLFGLVWLPLPPAVVRRKGLFGFAVAGLALALGLWWGSARMPATWDPVGFYTLPVKAANALGGLGFLAAALFFCRRYLRQSHPEDLAFVSLTVLFGMASLLFGLSHTWAADWWVWHGARLLAYAIVLGAAYETIVTLYRQIGERVQELEGRVQERTADLRQTNEVLQGQITERHRAEAELDRLFEVSPDLISIIGFDGCFKRLNPAWEKTLGHPLDDLLSRPFIEFVHPEDHEATNAEAAKLAQGARSLHFENRYRCKDGSYRWLSWAVIPAMEERLLYCVARDITQRRQAEAEVERRGEEQARLNAELTRSNRATLNLMQDAVQAQARLEKANQELQVEIAERLRAEEELRHHRDHLEQLVQERTEEVRAANAYNRGLIEASLDPLVTKGPDGRITDVNRATEAITGRSRQELIGTDFASYFTEPERARAGYQEVFREGEIRDYELALCHKDGSIRPVLYNATVYRDPAGAVVGVFAATHDITARKRAEEALRTLNSDLTRRSADLEAVNHELEAFSYSVSHDLKAPLRSVDGFAQMLEEDYAARLDDEGRRLLRVVRDSARDMGQLVNDLLTFSRLSRKDLKMARIKMSDLAQDARRQVEADAAGRTIRWDIDDLPPAFGDEATIREVLVNLLSNAVKFTRPRAEAVIGIDGRVEGEEVVYSVRDNGVGFDMTYKDKLFCVFQRLHASDEFEGTGIGLALVQRIVQRHGGRVWAEGKVNEGATFYFTLPREGSSDQ